MLTNKGSIYLVNDINFALECSYKHGSKVIYIGELNMNLPKSFVSFGALLPPYDALNAEIDGDVQTYAYLYENYLNNSQVAYEIFASIIVALYSGVNMLIYVEEGDELSHLNFLLEYLQVKFGITVGTDVSPFMYNPMYDSFIAMILYTYLDGFITPEMLLYTVPMDHLVAYEYNPYFNDPVRKLMVQVFGREFTFEEVVARLAEYQRKLLSTRYTEKRQFITFGGK
jgi:hypothetical protein